MLFIASVPLSLKLSRKPIYTDNDAEALNGLSSLIDANLPEQFRITTSDRKHTGFHASPRKKNNRPQKTASDRRRSSVFHSSLLLKDKKLYINKSLEKERPAGAQSMRVRELDHVLRISVSYISNFFPFFFLFHDRFSFLFFPINARTGRKKVRGTSFRVPREHSSNPCDLHVNEISRNPQIISSYVHLYSSLPSPSLFLSFSVFVHFI